MSTADEWVIALGMLNKQLLSPSDEATAALNDFGLDIENLRAKTLGEAVAAIAVRLDQFEDNEEKVIRMMALMGKYTIANIPALRLMAQPVR